jgi:hypothetical protein
VRTAISSDFEGIDTACRLKHYPERGVRAGVAACVRGEPVCNRSSTQDVPAVSCDRARTVTGRLSCWRRILDSRRQESNADALGPVVTGRAGSLGGGTQSCIES